MQKAEMIQALHSPLTSDACEIIIYLLLLFSILSFLYFAICAFLFLSIIRSQFFFQWKKKSTTLTILYIDSQTQEVFNRMHKTLTDN